MRYFLLFLFIAISSIGFSQSKEININWDGYRVFSTSSAQFEIPYFNNHNFNFTPSKGNDKHVRVNSCAPVFESGMVWAPETKFAEEVIEECAAFPFGDNDDLVDSMTQAVMRFRQGGLIQHPEDYKDEKQEPRKMVYY